MGKIDKEVLSYIAGYFDGEGCVYFDRTRLRCQVTSCYPASVKLISDLFGGSAIYTAPRRAHTRGYYSWSLGGPKTLPLLKAIVPYSLEKKRQIELSIEFLETDNKTRRAEIITQVKALKKVIYYEKKNTSN